jgi:hypothetical protein
MKDYVYLLQPQAALWLPDPESKTPIFTSQHPLWPDGHIVDKTDDQE